MMYLLCVCSMLGFVLSIDVDYYLGILRTKEFHSGNNKYCDRFCYGAPSIYQNGECYCHHQILTLGKKLYSNISTSINEDYQIDNSEENIAPPVLHSVYAENVEDRPALRHHIAHFCPNLDVARECIGKCIKRGLPAFCGKDHKCYCGHSYDPDHEKEPTDTETETYTQFKDLYEKYFGKRPSVKDVVVESQPKPKSKRSGVFFFGVSK